MKAPGLASVMPSDKPRNDYANAWLEWEEYGHWWKQTKEFVPLSEIEVPVPWSEQRLRDNIKWLRATGKTRPVQLTKGLQDAKYRISDGIHRCNAARMLGYDAIPAVASKEVSFAPPPAKDLEIRRQERLGWELFFLLKKAEPTLQGEVKKDGGGFVLEVEAYDNDDYPTWEIKYDLKDDLISASVKGPSSGEASGSKEEAARQISSIIAMGKGITAMSIKRKMSKVARWIGSLCKIAGWITEFGNEFDVPKEIQDMVMNGDILDMSWHNDTCPSFGKMIAPDTHIRIFVDHPDPNEREMQGYQRFSVTIDKPDGSAEELLDTDNLAEAIAMFRSKSQSPTPAKSGRTLEQILTQLYDLQQKREYGEEAQSRLREYQMKTRRRRPEFWQGPYPNLEETLRQD